LISSWQAWAVLSAVFAALTAIFAKVGVECINSDLATLIRTAIVLVALALILFATGQFGHPGPVSAKSWLSCFCPGLAPARPGCAISAHSSLDRRHRWRRSTS
jgi:bacterial/archaeal transporter family protein